MSATPRLCCLDSSRNCSHAGLSRTDCLLSSADSLLTHVSAGYPATDMHSLPPQALKALCELNSGSLPQNCCLKVLQAPRSPCRAAPGAALAGCECTARIGGEDGGKHSYRRWVPRRNASERVVGQKMRGHSVLAAARREEAAKRSALVHLPLAQLSRREQLHAREVDSLQIKEILFFLYLAG